MTDEQKAAALQRAFPNNQTDEAGISKLGYYASFALMALIVSRPNFSPEDNAIGAVSYAEALMDELEKRQKEPSSVG